MGRDDIPGILKNRGRRRESRWERFWRKRRMNALRNSSDHATAMAIGIVAFILIIGALLVVVVKRGGLPTFKRPGKTDLFIRPSQR